VPYLTDDPIDARALAQSVLRSGDGAAVVFEGVVRDHHEGHEVQAIDYEAYRPMAEKEIARIVESIHLEFSGIALALLHRLGHLEVGETSIAIVCTSAHRGEAFAACRATIDRIKETVPIWKKEHGPFGEEWVGWQK